jgi:hypothetical protein
MNDWITLRLKREDVGQLLDGLEIRQRQWHDSANYLRTGKSPYRGFIVEDARDEAEARFLADWYRRIIKEILQQRDGQKSFDAAT